MSRKWTVEEDSYLCSAYPSVMLERIARHLDRTELSIKARASRLGVVRRTNTPWTVAEDDYLRNTYPDGSLDVMAKYLNRSKEAIKARASELGIKRSDAYKEKLNKLSYDRLFSKGGKVRDSYIND